MQVTNRPAGLLRYFPSTENASTTLPGIPALIEYPAIT